MDIGHRLGGLVNPIRPPARTPSAGPDCKAAEIQGGSHPEHDRQIGNDLGYASEARAHTLG